jgi:hypothetical protein
MPRQVFTAGEILLAAEMNELADSTVMVFDDSAARGSAIPTPSEGMVTYLKDTDAVEVYKGAAFSPIGGGFTDSETITATNASWPVPTLASPIVKVTVIGGGGGGGATQTNSGATGGTTTFNAGGAGTVTATGGVGGANGRSSTAALPGSAGLASGNGGQSNSQQESFEASGQSGNGGLITVAYLNLSGISTVNVTIGAGGAGGAASPGVAGGAGGRGEVIVEYLAG